MIALFFILNYAKNVASDIKFYLKADIELIGINFYKAVSFVFNAFGFYNN